MLLFWKSFLPAYLNKKAEHLATHEDINKLVDQVQAVTTVTEQIKARISNEIWDRQKQWELKREMIIDMGKAISEMEEAMLRVKSALQVREEPETNEWMKGFYAATKAFRDATVSFDQARMLVDIVCSDNAAKLVHDYSISASTVCSKMAKTKNVKVYDDAFRELSLKYLAVIRALRHELGIADSAPQLGESTESGSPH